MKITMRFFTVLFLCTAFASCRQSQVSIHAYAYSNDPDSLVSVFYRIRKTDTEYVRLLLKNPYDCRVSFGMRYYGHSVYEAKMNALKRISGLCACNRITSKPDSAVVDFYKEWAVKNNYLSQEEKQ